MLDLFEVERFARFFRWHWNMTQIWGGYQFYRFCLKDKPPFCWEVYKHDAPKRLRVNYLFQPCTHIPSTSTPIKFQSAGSSWIPQLDAGGGWYIVAKCLLSCQRVFFGSRNQLQCEKKYPRTKKYMASEDSSKWTSTKRLRVLVSKMFYFYHDPSGNDFQSDSYCSGCSHSQGAIVPGKGAMIETAVQPHRDPPIFFPPIPMRNTE